MPAAFHTYPQYIQKVANATAKANSGTPAYRVILLTSYTYANTHATLADVLAAGTEVATGGGYTTGGFSGGLALASPSMTTSAFVFTFTSASPSWSTATISAAHAVFFDAQSSASNATAFPIAHWDFGGTFASTSGTFALTVNASGIWTVTGS